MNNNNDIDEIWQGARSSPGPGRAVFDHHLAIKNDDKSNLVIIMIMIFDNMHNNNDDLFRQGGRSTGTPRSASSNVDLFR